MSFVGDTFSWIVTHAWSIVAILLALPVFAVLQGIYFLGRFRLQYGDAPVPISPACGVVVVSPHDAETNNNWDGGGEMMGSDVVAGADDDAESGGGGGGGLGLLLSSNTTGGRRRSSYGSTDDDGSALRRTDSTTDDDANTSHQQQPLRLLLVGDSLAAGVGVSKSGTPVLPEIVAKTLSKALGGRAVYWTCVAEPGASSSWIVNELEKVQQSGGCEEEKEGGKRIIGSSSSSQRLTLEDKGIDDLAAAAGNSDPLLLENDRDEDEPLNLSDEQQPSSRDDLERQFRDRLDLHSKRLKSEVFGEYDVAIVMTGLNDLKGAILPCLLRGKEAEFRKQARERGGDYTAELKRVVDAVSEKMKVRLRRSWSRMRERMSSSLKGRTTTTNSSLLSLPTGATEEEDDDEEEVPYEELQEEEDDEGGEDHHPLIVLSALPSNLPVLQWPPFYWLITTLIRMADRTKRKLADKYPNELLFVDAPSTSSMSDFERRRGRIWNDLCREQTLLSLHNITEIENERIKSKMRDYYHEKQIRNEDNSSNPRDALLFGECNIPESVLPGSPGASLLSMDGIHWNDEGYDFWGRHIANEILEAWKK